LQFATIINEVINLELNSDMNTYIPKKIIRVRPRDKPWINSEIKCKIRKRNRVHKNAKFRNLDSSQGASGGTSGRSGSESMLDTDVK
jgi:hypothetical protein